MNQEEDTRKREQEAGGPAMGEPADIGAVADGEDPIEVLQQDLEKFRDLALRSQADLDNYRKRAERERQDAIRYANGGLLEKLLPVIDNFHLGLEAARGAGPEAKAVLDGMSMVLRQLEDFLREAGVRKVETEGAAFDPNVHEAVTQSPSGEVPEGHVVKELRRGYVLNDRLLRAANVIVSSGPPEGGGAD